MNFQQLKYVKALVDEGSFGGAAARCNVTQPTLSNGIAQLEAEFGQRLFQRTTRSVRLTAYGEHLLPFVVEVLQSIEALKARSKAAVEKSVVNSIQVGLSPLVGIRRAEAMLAGFRSKHPDIHIAYREYNFRELYELLRGGQVDIIISPYDKGLRLDTEHMEILMERDPLVFVPKSLDRQRWLEAGSVTLHDIVNETFVLVPDTCGLTSFTKAIFESNDMMLRRHIGDVGSYESIIEWAETGIGSGILPKSRMPEKAPLALPIVHDGCEVSIDYFTMGKPSTITRAPFSELWEALREARTVSTRQAPGPLARKRELRLIKTAP